MKTMLSFLALTCLVLAGCKPAPMLKAVQAVKTSVESTVTSVSSGTVEARQQAILGFTASGRVSRILVRIGDRVRRGQTIAELENTDLRTVFEDASRECERAKALFEANLVSQAALDEAQRNRAIAQANLDRTIIKAPFDGAITEMNLELGELSQVQIQATKPPVRIVDQKPRVIKANIDEIDLGKIRPGAKARVKIQAARPLPFPATVERVIPFVSTVKEQERTAQIELRLLETEGMIPVGASADVEIITDSKDDALAIPSRVVLGHADHKYVFKLEGAKARKTPIKAGIGNYDRTEILSGLSPGDSLLYPSEHFDLSDGQKVRFELQAWP